MDSNTKRIHRFLFVLVGLLVLAMALASYGEGEPDLDWCDLEELKDTYEEAKGTSEAAYAHQYLCMLEKSCEEHKKNSAKSWADGFVRSTFSYQRGLTEVRRGIDVSCPSSYSDSQCFKSASGVHGLCELAPSFTNYCDEISDLESAAYDDAISRWSDDHDLFLDNAFKPCFDEVVEARELSGDDGQKLMNAYESLARTARNTAQAYCDKKKSSSWGFLGEALALAESVNDELMCKK